VWLGLREYEEHLGRVVAGRFEGVRRVRRNQQEIAFLQHDELLAGQHPQ
jgi:hypothetical protein